MIHERFRECDQPILAAAQQRLRGALQVLPRIAHRALLGAGAFAGYAARGVAPRAPVHQRRTEVALVVQVPQPRPHHWVVAAGRAGKRLLEHHAHRRLAGQAHHDVLHDPLQRLRVHLHLVHRQHEAERVAAADDGDMRDAGIRHQEVLRHGVPRLVHGDLPALRLLHLLDRVLDAGVLLQECPFDVVLRYRAAVIEQRDAHRVLGDRGHDLGRRRRAVVHHDRIDVDRVIVVHRAQVAVDDLAPPGAVGQIHLDELVEAPGAFQRRVDHVGAVGGAHEQHVPVALGRLLAHDLEQLALHLLLEGLAVDAVHLVQQAGQGTGAAAHESAHAAAAAAAFAHHAAAALGHRVDLVDIGDRRAVALGKLARLADEPDHLHHVHAPEHGTEPGALDGDERDPGLAGHRLGQHRLAGAGRAVQEQAVDVASAHLHELLPVGQQPEPLPHQPLQPRLPPVVVEGDDLGIFGPDALDLGARHEPEQRPELHQHEQDGEQELTDEAEQLQEQVEQRLIEPDHHAEPDHHHQRHDLAHQLPHPLGQPALLLDHLDAVLDQVGNAHVVPEARLPRLLLLAVHGRGLGSLGGGNRGVSVRRLWLRCCALVLGFALVLRLAFTLVRHISLQRRGGGATGQQ